MKIETHPGVFVGLPAMDEALGATGWMKAEQHFDAACAAAMARDDAAYEREIAAFKAISATWDTTRMEAAQQERRGSNVPSSDQ